MLQYDGSKRLKNDIVFRHFNGKVIYKCKAHNILEVNLNAFKVLSSTL